MSQDFYSQIKDYEKREATKYPTRGTIVGIDGNVVDVLPRGITTILRNVRVVGTPTSNGQLVVLTWENGQPTAHLTGGSASPASAIIRGATGSQGPTGPAGPTGPEGPAGALTASSPIELIGLGSTPASPPAGSMRFYPKTDNRFYTLNSSGNEYQLVDKNTTMYYEETLGAFLAGATVPSPAGTIRYTGPFKNVLDTIANNIPWGKGGTAVALTIRTSNAQPSSGTLVVRLYVNSVATSLIATVPANGIGTSYTDTTNVVIPDDAFIRWEVTNNASATSAAITAIIMSLRKPLTYS